MTEFKVGDRVQVVRIVTGDIGDYTGATGTISYVSTFPAGFYGQEYVLTLDATDEHGVLENMAFFPEELEKIDD